MDGGEETLGRHEVGLVRSDDCVNLSRGDPRWLVGFTELLLPGGVAAISPGVGTIGRGQRRGSITE